MKIISVFLVILMIFYAFYLLCVKCLNVTKYIENNETFQKSNISIFRNLQGLLFLHIKKTCVTCKISKGTRQCYEKSNNLRLI